MIWSLLHCCNAVDILSSHDMDVASEQLYPNYLTQLRYCNDNTRTNSKGNTMHRVWHCLSSSDDHWIWFSNQSRLHLHWNKWWICSDTNCTCCACSLSDPGQSLSDVSKIPHIFGCYCSTSNIHMGILWTDSWNWWSDWRGSPFGKNCRPAVVAWVIKVLTHRSRWWWPSVSSQWFKWYLAGITPIACNEYVITAWSVPMSISDWFRTWNWPQWGNTRWMINCREMEFVAESTPDIPGHCKHGTQHLFNPGYVSSCWETLWKLQAILSNYWNHVHIAGLQTVECLHSGVKITVLDSSMEQIDESNAFRMMGFGHQSAITFGLNPASGPGFAKFIYNK